MSSYHAILFCKTCSRRASQQIHIRPVVVPFPARTNNGGGGGVVGAAPLHCERTTAEAESSVRHLLVVRTAAAAQL